jgi:hypothetical protein
MGLCESVHGNLNNELRASAFGRLSTDAAPMLVHDLLAEIQAETEARAVAALVGLEEALKNLNLQAGRNADSVVANRQPYLLRRRLRQIELDVAAVWAVQRLA